MSTKKNSKSRRWGKTNPTSPTSVGPILTEEDRLAEEQRLAACICNRDKTTVQCVLCGNLSFSRMYRECSVHKNVVFLYDMRNCPKCQASLIHLEELPIDYETYQKLARLHPKQP